MDRLKNILNRIDNKGYKAYKDIQGSYRGDIFTLHIDYVQPDPFANPSRIRIEIPKSNAKYESDWYKEKHRKIAFCDFLTREISNNIKSLDSRKFGTGKSGLILVDTPGQEILERSSVNVDDKRIEFRLCLGLPAAGRSVLGRDAAKMLLEVIPRLVKSSILSFKTDELEAHLKLVDNQEFIRKFLDNNNGVAFIANDSILPRESGVSSKPLRDKSLVPFKSPSSLEVEIPLPHGKPVKGMLIKGGITLIVGGGYHGKSTLLSAIELGVYNHIKGDGREYVITNSTAFKVRAEDGRSIEGVNISPFISKLPFNKDTKSFSTPDASGSTSQAANIIEAIETGSKVLLIDEDTSATNFMIRDARIQELVNKEKEPITPFIDKVKQLYKDLGVSTILVIGGSGDYFDVADSVIMMDEYIPYDVTERARNISLEIKNNRVSEGGERFGTITPRTIKKESLSSWNGRKEKIDAKGLHTILYGNTLIDLSLVEQLVDSSQTNAISYIIKYISDKLVNDNPCLSDVIDKVYRDIEVKGIDVISPYFGKHPGNLAMPRKQEVAAAINRMRGIKFI